MIAIVMRSIVFFMLEDGLPVSESVFFLAAHYKITAFASSSSIHSYTKIFSEKTDDGRKFEPLVKLSPAGEVCLSFC